MKTTQIEIPDGKEAKWVDGVLTLVDEQPKEKHVYKIGDKAILVEDTAFRRGDGICFIPKGTEVEITYTSLTNSELYDIKFENAKSVVRGYDLTPVITQDITERIKTFADACKWCNENGMSKLVEDYDVLYYDWPYTHGGPSDDILAYLQLRIITCALNEGWEPRFEDGEKRWIAEYEIESGETRTKQYSSIIRYSESSALIFKHWELAEYAATQFKDIYMDFCYKGKEQA